MLPFDGSAALESDPVGFRRDVIFIILVAESIGLYSDGVTLSSRGNVEGVGDSVQNVAIARERGTSGISSEQGKS